MRCQCSREKTREARESRLTNASAEEQRANTGAKIEKSKGSVVERPVVLTLIECVSVSWRGQRGTTHPRRITGKRHGGYFSICEGHKDRYSEGT